MGLEREFLMKEATFRQAEGLVLADPERLIHKMLAHFQVRSCPCVRPAAYLTSRLSVGCQKLLSINLLCILCNALLVHQCVRGSGLA